MKIRRFMKRLKRNLLGLWIVVSYVFRRTYIANACGHRTKLIGWAEALGRNCLMGMPVEDNGRPDHCLECVAKMAIRCAWCGGPILITERVTLRFADESTRPDAAHDPDDERLVVGCIGCAEMGAADCCAHWMPPGRPIRYESVSERLERRVAAGEECPIEMIGP
jgi:hypothetical protein